MTDDVHMSAHADRWEIRINTSDDRESRGRKNRRCHLGCSPSGNSRIFLWNVFPLHPQEQDEPFTNRAHNAPERRAGEELLETLVGLLRPLRVIAIGNDAGNTARRVCQQSEILQVRHPSYGGQTEFLNFMRQLYAVRDRKPRLFEC